MENIEKNWINYFVDFAHSPDAIEKTLEYLSSMKWEGRMITVFWAPWNRDKLKRPIMWNIVQQYSDIMIITDDDPDTENRLDIIWQILDGVKNKTEWKDLFVIPERILAIKFACEIAKPWDTLMFAGKWHENIQFTNFGKRKWNDKEEIIKNIGN
jgi:UDP-N-acetylmuramoyl-L-alanyl-D-glutamate--2,6-diaminopimelate ligase